MAKFLRFIVNTIMIVAIVVAASLLIPPFAGVTTLIVDDMDMETNLEMGSVTYAWGVDAGELNVGDKVLLQEEGDMLYVISSVEGSEFVLEDTLSADGAVVTKEMQGMIDKVVLTVPVLGYVSMALATKEGLIIVGLSVVFVIILFILAEIWRKEEEEDWEEGEEDSDESAAEGNNEDADKKENKQQPTPQETVAEPVKEESCAEENKEDAIVVSDEFVQTEKDLFEETSDSLAADVASMMGLDVHSVSDKNKKVSEEMVQKASKDEESTKTTKKVLAMPLYTKEELLERAKAAGDEPELVMDELSGVTFLDYSDVL